MAWGRGERTLAYFPNMSFQALDHRPSLLGSPSWSGSNVRQWREAAGSFSAKDAASVDPKHFDLSELWFAAP